MWDIQILGVDLYHVLFWLILYSFITGPVCTIYGVGAMSV